MGLWDYIVLALGWVIKTIYDLVQNYGVAIILFTIVMKLLLLPLNIKSQKAMKKQQKIQPLLAELQKKYANDQQKLQQETMKLYKENNVSMMGGCLPMLLQMPILIALYQAIQKPITYMFGVSHKNLSDEVVNKIVSIAEKAGQEIPKAADGYRAYAENIMKVEQINLSSWAGQIGGKVHEWYINFDFLGLDLSCKPQSAFAAFADPANNIGVILLLLIPILAMTSSVLQSKLSMKQSGNKNNEQMQSTNAMMTWMMPLMTGWFTLILPAGIGLYWIISGIVQIIQQLALNYYFDKKGEDVVVKVPEKRIKHGKKGKKH